MMFEPAPSSLVVPALLGLVALASVFLLIFLSRASQEAARHSLELASLAEAAARLGRARLDPEELAEVAYEEAARFLDTDFFQLGIFEGDTYRTLIWVRDYERQDNQAFNLTRDSLGIVGWVRRTGSPLLVTDFRAQRDQLPAQPSYQSADPPTSGVFVPLVLDGQTLGVLSIQSRRGGAFDDHHLKVLQVLALALTSSLAVSGMQSEVRYRSLYLALLREISRQVISLRPLNELMTGAVAMIAQALEGYVVRLYERADDTLLLRASSAEEDDAAPKSLALESVILSATSPGRPTSDQLSPGQAFLALGPEHKVVGVLELTSEVDLPIPAEHLELAETIGGQLALAMLEARHYSQEQEEAWVTTVLLEVARHAAQTGDTDEALQAVLQLATLLAGVTWAILLIPDPVDGQLLLGPTAGLQKQLIGEHAELRLAPSDLLAVPNQESETPYRVPLPPHLAEHFEAKEAIALSLSDGQSLLGLLLLEAQDLSGRRAALLAGIAHQVSLRLENARLIERVALQRSMERELAMARGIQESFLPKHPPQHPGWEIGMTWRLAREVGGDFYDFIPLEPGPDGPRWGLAIADVADKGVPAALFMALCRTLLRSVAISRIDPGLTLSRLNDLILNDAQAGMFASVFYAVWEPQTGKITYANGGHNPPKLFERGREAKSLVEHEIVLGIERGIEYRSHTLTLPTGSLLLLYTDGVTEVANEEGELFGEYRLESLVQGSADWQAQAVAEEIADRVSEHCADPELPDDLTAVILRRRPA